MERIELDTEHHRTQKALKRLLHQQEAPGPILFADSRIAIDISPDIAALPGGQLALVLMINLLARMQSIIASVSIPIPPGIQRHSNVPLDDDDLRLGLDHLVSSINGPALDYPVTFSFDDHIKNPVVCLVFGAGSMVRQSSQVTIQADAWAAYINVSQKCSDWSTPVPFGPHLAACLGVAEVFKRLLHHNFPHQIHRPFRFLEDTTFCGLTYGEHSGPAAYPTLPNPIRLDGVAIAGTGAGGSAAVYTLGCLPGLTGEIALLDPGRHKRSNLARYLLSTYQDCFEGTLKARAAHNFLQNWQPAVHVRCENHSYADVAHRDFRLVVSTVDTPEARWDIQRDNPSVILDAAVLETIYALLRIEPGDGMCLGCKHPYDPDVTWKRRAAMWGKTMDVIHELYIARAPVQWVDIAELAEVQGRPIADFVELLGRPFDEVPQLTECGQSRFDLQIPNQAATLPFVTAIAGVLVAAEVVKNQCAPRLTLRNWFEHDLLWSPKPDRHRFRRRILDCHLHPY
ncbi:MAG: ThiF family adenylyltransferase [Gammaproteobacteria bacterium]|nr:ThiF family adenylyltransferase [Gammaproteobacteria bacterium]